MDVHHNQPKSGEYLIEALDKADGLQAISDIAEAVLDSFTQDGLLKEIPIIGSAISLVKTSFALRDYLVLKKIIIFMSGCEILDKRFKLEFTEKCKSDPKYRRQMGEHIISALERFDQISKGVST